MTILKPQIYFSWKQREDVAKIVPFGDDGFLSSDTAKFSPFDGTSVTRVSDAVLPVPWSDLGSLVSIGQCSCGSNHSADVSSVTALIDNECKAFYCVDCGKAVEIDIAMGQYLEAASEESGDATVISDEIKDETKPEVTPAPETDDTAELTDDTFEETVARLVDEAMDNIEIDGIDIADDADGDGDKPSGENNSDEDPVVIDDTDDPEATGDVKPVDDKPVGDTPAPDAPAADVTPPAEKPVEEKPTEPKADVTPAVDTPEGKSVEHHRHSKKPVEDEKPKKDDEAALFTKTDENPEGKTFAEIIEGAPDDKKDTAAVIAVSNVTNLDQADIACVMNSKRTRYIVFVDDKPAGTLSRELCHADNASLFDDGVFVKGFIRQFSNKLDVSRFGFQTYAVRVDTAGIVEQFTEKQRADIAEDLSAKFNGRLEVIKTSLLTAATACNKGVWGDFTNPIREAIVARLETLGIDDADFVVNKAFVEQASLYVENLLTKALELSDKSDVAREEITRMVDTANYVVHSNGGGFATKLAKFGETVLPQDTASTISVKPNTVITGREDRAGDSSKQFNWDNAF